MDASLAENKVLIFFYFSTTLASREFEWNLKFKILEIGVGGGGPITITAFEGILRSLSSGSMFL